MGSRPKKEAVAELRELLRSRLGADSPPELEEVRQVLDYLTREVYRRPLQLEDWDEGLRRYCRPGRRRVGAVDNSDLNRLLEEILGRGSR